MLNMYKGRTYLNVCSIVTSVQRFLTVFHILLCSKEKQEKYKKYKTLLLSAVWQHWQPPAYLGWMSFSKPGFGDLLSSFSAEPVELYQLDSELRPCSCFQVSVSPDHDAQNQGHKVQPRLHQRISPFTLWLSESWVTFWRTWPLGPWSHLWTHCSPRLLSLVSWPTLGRVLLIPNFFHCVQTDERIWEINIVWILT